MGSPDGYKQFGCGCHSGFNANSFNNVLGVVVCAASLVCLALAANGLTGIRKYLYLALGGLFQVISTFAGLIFNEWR
mgnify:CR=1 FL=1